MSDDQQTYWDRQTQRDGYCGQFLQGAKDAKWLKMLENSLAVTGSRGMNAILEIGGGSQLLSRYLCNRYLDANVVCTDISQERVDLFQNFYQTKPPLLSLQGDVNAERLPFNNEQFDLIVGDAVISHFEDLKRGLLEINRCLKVGGHAIFIREPVLGGLGVLVYQILQALDKDRPHVLKNRYEFKRVLSQWKFEFIMAGFKVKVVPGWSHNPFRDRIRSLFPRIFPCWSCFIIQKKFDFYSESDSVRT